MNTRAKPGGRHNRTWQQCPQCHYIFKSGGNCFICQECQATHSFSARTFEGLKLIAEGYNNPDIGKLMVISRRSVENVVHQIFQELPCLKGAKRVGAARWYWVHVKREDDEQITSTPFNHRSPGVDGLRTG